MADLHLATIEALALAIDAKDQTAQTHIRRVQVYAAGLARSLGMTDNEIQGVKTAALLHDIGKLAVPEHILSKPGPLTQEEFQKIRIHPQVGAEIISAVPFPYPVAPLILSHHERWDGKGYPHGLRGEEIPLGARILSVVDYFDALTSDRPYHRALSHEAAMLLLQQEAGRALDPAVVDVFIEQLPELTERHRISKARRQTSLARADLGPGGPAAGFQSDGSKGTTVFDDIAHAHREIYALYEIAQTMGTSLGVSDTMSLITSKLTSLVPFTSCALFLYDEPNDMLRCRFATGTEADDIGTMMMRAGHGLAGLGGAQPAAARQRAPERGLRGGRSRRGDRSPLRAGVTARLQRPLIGTLVVYHIAPDFYTDDHRRLLDRVSEQASAVIHNSIVFEQTQEDSLTDPLTGLPNTRFMFMHLARELTRAERLKSEVALLVMDLDNFKEINDTYGHHVGDRALRDVARVLRTAIRPYDICVRYAGDEFIVVLPGCGAEEGERKRLELQRAVEGLMFEARPGRRAPMRMSVGAAIFPHDGDTYEALLATADSRMYRDKTRRKQKGRKWPPRRAPMAGPASSSRGEAATRTCRTSTSSAPASACCDTPCWLGPCRSPRSSSVRFAAPRRGHAFSGSTGRGGLCLRRGPGRHRRAPSDHGPQAVFNRIGARGVRTARPRAPRPDGRQRRTDPHLELAVHGTLLDVEGPFGTFCLPPLGRGARAARRRRHGHRAAALDARRGARHRDGPDRASDLQRSHRTSSRTSTSWRRSRRMAASL